MFFFYELDTWSQDLDSDFTLKNCIFGGVKLGENADPEKYVYSRLMVLDSIHVHFFHFQILIGVKIAILFELI